MRQGAFRIVSSGTKDLPAMTLRAAAGGYLVQGAHILS